MFNTSEVLMRSERGKGVGSQCRLICQHVVPKKLREEVRPSVREERDQFVTIRHFLLYPLSFNEAHEMNDFLQKMRINFIIAMV